MVGTFYLLAQHGTRVWLRDHILLTVNADRNFNEDFTTRSPSFEAVDNYEVVHENNTLQRITVCYRCDLRQWWDSNISEAMNVLNSCVIICLRCLILGPRKTNASEMSNDRNQTVILLNCGLFGSSSYSCQRDRLRLLMFFT